MTDGQTSGTDVVQRLHDSFNDRHADGLRACLAADVRWHVAGDNPLAGTFEGREEVWERHFQPLWPSPARVEHDRVVEHGRHVVAFGHEVHDFGEGERAWPTVEVVRLRDGHVAERWAFTEDQPELDDFLIRGCAAALDEAPTGP